MSENKYKSNSTAIFLSVIFFIAGMYSCKDAPEAVKVADIKVTDQNTVILTNAQKKLAEIKTSQLAKISMGGLIHLSGKTSISPQNLVSVSAPIGGFIRSMPWMSGMKVKKGQVIAVIENKDFIQLQQDYLMAKSSVYYAEKELDRQRALIKTQSTSDKLLLVAEEMYRLKRTETRGLEEKLKLININPNLVNDENMSSKTNIIAQVNGYISSVNVNIGKYVQASEVIVDIIDNSKPFIVLKAFEKDLPYLSIGNVVAAHTNNLPDKKYVSTIALIGNDFKAEGYVEVTCFLNVNEHDIMPGTYMMADIESSTAERWAVMEETVVTFEGEEYMFIEEKDNNYLMVKTKTGLNENGFIEIFNHEDFEGKKLVSKGAYSLLMKMKNVSE